MSDMIRINRLIQDDRYAEYLKKNEEAESERIYCRHGEGHGLTVARIAYIYCLEQQAVYPGSSAPTPAKEMIYAAGLLHDIGRWVEYETGEDHSQVGARLARPLLLENGFGQTETELICQGIAEHRYRPEETSGILGTALALADDWARDCKNCRSQKTCHKYSKALEELYA